MDMILINNPNMREQSKASESSDVICKPTKVNTCSKKDKSSKTKLFVGGLSVKVKDSQLRMYMEQFGNVHRVSIIKKEGISKGFGFITFVDADAAQVAVEAKHMLEDKDFNCKFILSDLKARQSMQEEKDRKIYLKGLSKTTTNTDLYDYFSNVGDVERAVINKNLDETSKGSGFVLFHRKSTVEYLLSQENHWHTIRGKGCKIYECLLKKEIDLHAQEQKQINFKTNEDQKDSISLLEEIGIKTDMPISRKFDLKDHSNMQKSKQKTSLMKGLISTERSSSSNNDDTTSSSKRRSDISGLESEDLLNQIALLSKQWANESHQACPKAMASVLIDMRESAGVDSELPINTCSRGKLCKASRPQQEKESCKDVNIHFDCSDITSSSWKTTLFSTNSLTGSQSTSVQVCERRYHQQNLLNLTFRIEGGLFHQE